MHADDTLNDLAKQLDRIITGHDQIDIFNADGVQIAVIPWPQPGKQRDEIAASRPPLGRPETLSQKS